MLDDTAKQVKGKMKNANRYKYNEDFSRDVTGVEDIGIGDDDECGVMFDDEVLFGD